MWFLKHVTVSWCLIPCADTPPAFLNTCTADRAAPIPFLLQFSVSLNNILWVTTVRTDLWAAPQQEIVTIRQIRITNVPQSRTWARDYRTTILRRLFYFWKLGNACYHSVQNILSSSLLSKNLTIKIYRTIILHVVLYGCETWSLTLREEHRLRVFENRVLRRIFGDLRGTV